MKKLQYIQPEVKAVTLLSQGIMVPGGGSPVDGTMDPMPKLSRRKDGTRAVF